MMEYTMARVVTIVCSVALIATVMPPVQAMLDDSESSEMQEQSENLCRMIDAFFDSDADQLVIQMNTVLPKNSSVSMKGHFVTITDGDTSYRYDTRCEMVPVQDCYGPDDIVRFTRGDGKVIVERY